MSVSILVSGTDKVVAYAEKCEIVNYRPPPTPLQTFDGQTLRMHGPIKSTYKVKLENVFVNRSVVLAYSNHWQSFLSDREFDVDVGINKVTRCCLSSVDGVLFETKEETYICKNLELIGDNVIENLEEEDMLGNLLFVAVNDKIVGFVETFTRYKPKKTRRVSSMWGVKTPVAQTINVLSCNNMMFDIELFDDEEETAFLEEGGKGLITCLVYGKPSKHTACPHDCLGLDFDSAMQYLDKKKVAFIAGDVAWVPNYVMKNQWIIFPKMKFRWVEEQVFMKDSWDGSQLGTSRKSATVTPVFYESAEGPRWQL